MRSKLNFLKDKPQSNCNCLNLDRLYHNLTVLFAVASFSHQINDQVKNSAFVDGCKKQYFYNKKKHKNKLKIAFDPTIC